MLSAVAVDHGNPLGKGYMSGQQCSLRNPRFRLQTLSVRKSGKVGASTVPNWDKPRAASQQVSNDNLRSGIEGDHLPLVASCDRLSARLRALVRSFAPVNAMIG